MTTLSSLSIVTPVYNDAEAVSHLLDGILANYNKWTQQLEIIMVNDGSKDHIKDVYKHFLQKNPNKITFKLINLSRNFGKEAALTAGLSQAKNDWTLFIDSDGQHPLELVEQMVELTSQGNEMIAGVQVGRENETVLLRVLKKWFYRLIQDKNRFQLKPNAGDFRLMSNKVRKSLMQLPERQRFMKGLYAWVGFKTAFIPFQAKKRNSGKSKFRMPELFELAFVAITSFSQKPLRWISRLGILVSILSLCYGLYIVVTTLFYGVDLPGWATLSAAIMLLAGLQLICIGVIGEYIGRIYEEVKQRPVFLIDEVYSSSDPEEHEK